MITRLYVAFRLENGNGLFVRHFFKSTDLIDYSFMFTPSFPVTLRITALKRNACRRRSTKR
ncbi:hypothetical protein L400_00882 [Enterobacter hormaechei]|nr:hypothetical protein L400_00882 [Enterobacter hormaechei]SAH79007.1 Uncharacterised protein [Enterobacter cloacae]